MAKKRRGKKTGKRIPTTRVSVIVVTQDKILLVKHRKGSRQYWVLPGGRLEYGEDFQECAVREVKEETGLDVVADRIVFISEAIAPDRQRHIINIFVQAHVVGGTMKVGNEPVLAGVDLVAVAELSRLTLYPPVSRQVLAGIEDDFNTIKYLGNLWV